MTDGQWERLVGAVRGEAPGDEPLAAFIVDSPWLPGWRGISILDYLAGDEAWFAANRAAVEAFPAAALLPGFWAEYGMCTEPSAFGARCSFPEDEFPFARPLAASIEELDGLEDPDPSRDGLLPLVIKRMLWARPRMEAIGHSYRFAVSRGPLNIASFLLGVTEFLTAMKTEPERVHRLLARVTSFICRWLTLQRERFPSIDGLLVLDDIVGFIGEEDFREFALPCLSEIFSPPASIKLFHNDADCAASVRYYSGMGVNLYNPGIQLGIGELLRRSGGSLGILGSIPPRDVLASASPGEVEAAVARQLRELPAGARVIHSCAGGMPPGVRTESIDAFLRGLSPGRAKN
jgi:uroporphyrinogen-III decarboxylase